MGKEAIKIVDFDINELVIFLNKAVADEWLAYCQLRLSIIGELERHAIAKMGIKKGNLLTSSLFYSRKV